MWIAMGGASKTDKIELCGFCYSNQRILVKSLSLFGIAIVITENSIIVFKMWEPKRRLIARSCTFIKKHNYPIQKNRERPEKNVGSKISIKALKKTAIT